MSRTEKLAFLHSAGSISKIKWQELQPDEKFTWITENLHAEFETFMPIGSKESKASTESLAKAIFRTYTNGVKTNRDNWVYDFNKALLQQKVNNFIEMYNSEIDRWVRAEQPEDVDNFVRYDDTQIKWSRDLKSDLKRKRYAQFQLLKIRYSLYRPYTKRCYFFDAILSQDIFLQPRFFPTIKTEEENVVIWLKVGSEWPMFALATNLIADLLPQGGSQCFPFYTYNEDGTNRRENITDWSLTQFQAKYGPSVSKWDIFHYVYAMLHHPQYRERYAENLKHDLPHIPLLHSVEPFQVCVRIGRDLMDLHLHYEQAREYSKLEWFENEDVPFSWRVEKMRLSTDRRVVVVNESLRLGPVPPECFAYRLGNRSALEWVIDQYQVSKDARSGIVSDPNNLDDEEYIVRLIGRVVTVSVETVRLVGELAGTVTMGDWMDEGVQA